MTRREFANFVNIRTERLNFRSEAVAIVAPSDIKRLNPNGVARDNELIARGHHKCKHTVKFGDPGGTTMTAKLQDRFRIRVCRESAIVKYFPKGQVIVNHAIRDDGSTVFLI